MKAMIYAAGLGTRLRPLTDDRPKALIEVGGKPMLQHVIENLKKAGITRAVVNVHHFAGKVIDFLDRNGNFVESFDAGGLNPCCGVFFD